MKTITLEQAKLFILEKQGLNTHKFHGKTGILKFVEMAGCLQYDPVDVVGKNAEIVLKSRISDFQKNDLYDSLYVDRSLLDQWDKNMAIYLKEDFPYFNKVREYYSKRHHDSFIKDEDVNIIREDLNNYTFLTHQETRVNDLITQQPYRTIHVAQAILDYLFMKGEVIIHHKDNAKRYNAKTESLLDASLLDMNKGFKDLKDYQAWHLLRRVKALGLLWKKRSDAFLGIVDFKSKPMHEAFEKLLVNDAIRPIQVEGIQETFYYAKTDEVLLNQVINNQISTVPRLEFIAPLDNLIWDRNTIKTLFNFEYIWEIYTPASKRKYGRYTLPILYNLEFVGRIQLNAITKTKTLVLENIWLEKPVDKNFKQLLEDKIYAFKEFNACTKFLNASNYKLTLKNH